MSVVMKQHDRLPAMTSTLKADGAIVDLTNAVSVKFIMTLRGTTQPTVNAAAAFVSKPDGTVIYSWGASDTSAIGTYDAEWEITWPGNLPQTFPGGSYITVDIRADLG